MSWLRSAMTKAVEVGNNTNLTRAVVQHAGQAVAEGAKILQDRIAARNYRSVAQTIKRLEEAAITYRGPERVELLRRWLVVLKEVDKLSRAADDKEKTFEHHLGVEELKDNPRKPSLVERQFSECSKSLQWNKDRVRELETQLKSLQEDLISAKDAAAANEERLSAELSTEIHVGKFLGKQQRFMVIKGMIKGCPYLKIKLRWWKRSIIVKKKELISPLPKPQQEEQGEKEEPPKKEEPHQPPQENKDQLLDKAIEKNPLCLMNLDGVIGQVTIPEQVNIPDQVTTQDGVPLMMIMALEIHPTQHFCQLPLMKMDMDGREVNVFIFLFIIIKLFSENIYDD
ncbi:hypothetical protein Ahy_B04g071259 [Arachis hypogaea]|uniref:Uncharacterized protein n=1 Tax=Arachis hypogaea TaxID=3818 RepID=A0A444ZKD6_ARAHY|nr:hypothetical protein Ahy_B04g071259 [Arachis hypogaea]